MPQRHQYTKIERERRFLLAQFPNDAPVVRKRRIVDSYIEGTTLRLRKQNDNDGLATFKLTQKLSARGSGAQQGFITSMYLAPDEFQVLDQLPARKLSKTRFSVPPFGIDIFEGLLEGLILAEAEFDEPEDADSFRIPSFAAAEVSLDNRFTGGRLTQSSREDLKRLLIEYGIVLV